MEWITDLIGVGASAGAGGLFGLFGALAGQVSKYLQEKQRQEWERAKWDREERMLHLQMQARKAETEQEVLIANSEGSWRGLEASHSSAVDMPSYRWVAAAKSLFRPLLTIALWVLAAWVFHLVTAKANDLFTEIELKDLVRYMVYSIFFSAMTAGVWWFGDRALTPPQLKNR
ncbi:MAG: hypothetical protein ACRBBW_03865 [Cellvibrionaceae bacterium]